MSAHRLSTANAVASVCLSSDRVVQHVLNRLTTPKARKPRGKKVISLPKLTIQTR